MIMPTRQMPTNMASRFGFTTRESMVSDGIESTVTLIMKARMVPRPTPFWNSASAMGMVPKMSA